MIWGAIWIGGRSDLIFMERDEAAPRQGYSAKSYIQVLDDQIERIYQPGMIFQQDNAGIHTAGEVQEWFEEHGIHVVEWPPHSPDLNPIEHVWRMLKDAVNRNHPHLVGSGRSKVALEDFQRAIIQEWEGLDQEKIDHLIRSMDYRVNHVLAAKGWHTKY